MMLDMMYSTSVGLWRCCVMDEGDTIGIGGQLLGEMDVDGCCIYL